MASTASSLNLPDFSGELDGLLFDICDELQLPPYLHRQAEDRYNAVARVLEAPTSVFARFSPRIYPQGSMRLGTTVPAIDGPRDLDFVLEISAAYSLVDPMNLIHALFSLLKGNAVYRDMVELKNRCVRIVYANEFYMDILPACQDPTLGGTCIRVPDREVQSWKASNPVGYANWFQSRAELGRVILIEKVAPLPKQQSTEDKWPLQLIVQLLKRWRDIFYGGAECAPISVVLTTLAAQYYGGEQSVSAGILCILRRVGAAVAEAEQQGKRIHVLNPSNPAEDLSERWDADPHGYQQFSFGIRNLCGQWEKLMARGAKVDSQLEKLFGEPVKRVHLKRALRLQEARNAGLLGVSPAGRITAAAAAILPLRPNTFHGE